MLGRRVTLGGALSVLAVVAVLVLGFQLLVGGSDPYVVRVQLADAAGLRDGSEVRMGGAVVGFVRDLRLSAGDRVEARLELDRGDAKVGSGASAAIRSSNLLGAKFVELQPGDLGDPARSGVRIPAGRVREPVELDQVLSVLDADTRARLTILLNEAGSAVAGRREDFSDMLAELPPTFDEATRWLGELTADTTALRELVVHSDRFIAALARERTQLTRLVDTAGEAVRATADRQQELRATLAQTPGTLSSLRRFLGELEVTTEPLGPAAQAITASAPRLTQTLAALPQFQKAAEPALKQAELTAPRLTALADKATPVASAAASTLSALSRLASSSPELMKTLNAPQDGIDGALGAAEGWARAVQGRDGVGHVFRGHISFSSDAIQHLVSRINRARARERSRRRSRAVAPRAQQPQPSAPRPSAPGRSGDPVERVKGLVDRIRNGVSDVLGGGAGRPTPPPDSESELSGLLDYLLEP